MAKLKCEEAEKQGQAAIRLAKQRHEVVMRKKAELMDNHSLYSHHSSELNLLKDRGSDRIQRLFRIG